MTSPTSHQQSGGANRSTFVGKTELPGSPAFSGGMPPPALSSRPWFFLLLPAADVRRTEAALHSVQRRLDGFIRFVTGLPHVARNASSAASGNHELLTGAAAGDLASVQQQISLHADINHVGEHGMNAIMNAAANGRLDMIKALVAAGANLDASNSDSETALMLAAKNGHAEVVGYLIKWGADATKADRKGLTALVFALRSGHNGAVQSFNNAGFGIDAPGKDGITPLMSAALSGEVDSVRALIKHGANAKALSTTGSNALMMAAQNGHADIVKRFLEEGVAVKMTDNHGWDALMLAASNGHTGVVQILLENRASVETMQDDGLTALMLAAGKGYADIAKLLLSASLDAFESHENNRDRQDAIAEKIMTAMMHAAKGGHHAMVRSFIETGFTQDYVLSQVFAQKDPKITNVILRAWLGSKKKRLDGVSAIRFFCEPWGRFHGASRRHKAEALLALAAAGLTLTKKAFATFDDLPEETKNRIEAYFILNAIPDDMKIGNAVWAFNHDLADELIDGARSFALNPFGLNLNASLKHLTLKHITSNNGQYRHVMGELVDESPTMCWEWQEDRMLVMDWRSRVTALVRKASKDATQASRQISKLMADTEKGMSLIDEAGSPVPADNIRLRDTLLAFELERNQPLNQIAEPPDSSPASKPMTQAQTEHQQASKAQAKAILASNKAYKSLKLNMPALIQARKLEELVQSGGRIGSEGLQELFDRLFSETEQMFFDAPGITSELALHWFRSEVGEACKELGRIRDKIKEMEYIVS